MRSCYRFSRIYNNRTNKISDKLERILSAEATIDDTAFALINIYNGDTELEQIKSLSDLLGILEKVKDIQNKNTVLEGDFNVIFDISLNAMFKKEINNKIDSK